MESGNNKSKIIFLAVVIVAVLALTIIGWRGGWFQNRGPVLSDDQIEEASGRFGMTPSEISSIKSRVLSRMKNQTPLTEEERQEIVGYLIGDRILFYGFTTNEKDMIIDKLNE